MRTRTSMLMRASILLGVLLASSCSCDQEELSDLRYMDEGQDGDEPTVLADGSDLTSSTLRARSDAAMAWCPVAGGGVRVVVENIDSGAALVFTTEDGSEDALRARVLHMAEMHNRHYGPGRRGQGEGRGMGPGAQGAGGWRWATVGLAETVAVVEDVDDGARLAFHSEDPAEVGQLRERLPMAAERMGRGDCPRMEPEMESAE